MCKVIAIANQKGVVAKTTTTKFQSSTSDISNNYDIIKNEHFDIIKNGKNNTEKFIQEIEELKKKIEELKKKKKVKIVSKTESSKFFSK